MFCVKALCWMRRKRMVFHHVRKAQLRVSVQLFPKAGIQVMKLRVWLIAKVSNGSRLIFKYTAEVAKPNGTT